MYGSRCSGSNKRGYFVWFGCSGLVHNHPSGKIRPSREDDKLTKEVNTVCQLKNIQMVVYLIVTDRSFYCYADEDRI